MILKATLSLNQDMGSPQTPDPGPLIVDFQLPDCEKHVCCSVTLNL